MARGPDFICIGLQKAGTGWLFDQLRFHPGFWMPPVKELHYFDRFPSPALLRLMDAYERDGLSPNETRNRTGRPLDERDELFFRAVRRVAGKDATPKRYASLFRAKGDLLSGDVCPSYSILDQETVDAIANELPEVKIVLLLREPASRAWSQLCMRAESGSFSGSLDDPEAVTRELDHGIVAERSFPSQIAARWMTSFGERFRFFFLDDVAQDPEATIADITRFIGCGDAVKATVPSDFNRKSAPKPKPTPEIAAILSGRFGQERAACAALFGGRALEWVADKAH